MERPSSGGAQREACGGAEGAQIDLADLVELRGPGLLCQPPAHPEHAPPLSCDVEG